MEWWLFIYSYLPEKLKNSKFQIPLNLLNNIIILIALIPVTQITDVCLEQTNGQQNSGTWTIPQPGKTSFRPMLRPMPEAGRSSRRPNKRERRGKKAPIKDPRLNGISGNPCFHGLPCETARMESGHTATATGFEYSNSTSTTYTIIITNSSTILPPL